MAIRNAKLGGTDFANGEVLYDYDLDDTNNQLINIIGIGHAQNAYQTVEVSAFNNKDYLVADFFSDEDGKNATVDTTNSTATFDSVNTKYVSGITDEASGDTTHDPDSFANASNAFDGNDATYADKTTSTNGSYELGKTFTSKFIGMCKVKIYLATLSSSTCGADLEVYDGSTWNTIYELVALTINTTGPTTFNIPIGYQIEGIRVNFTNSGSSDTTYMYVYTLEYGDFDLSSTVICDTNIKTLDGTEESICIYADKTLPTNTSMTVDISDGTTTLSAQALDTVISIGTLTAASDLELTFNLSTTDTEVTPTLKGYGVFIK